jgi:hypothetical protein
MESLTYQSGYVHHFPAGTSAERLSAGREIGEARGQTRSNGPEGTKVAPYSYEDYLRELKSQLPGYQHRVHPSLRPHLADSTYSTFRVGRIGDRYHLDVIVAGEPKWVFHSIPKDAIYDLFISIRDVDVP